MSPLPLITHFLLQSTAEQGQNIARLDSTILIPATCGVVILAMIAGIAVAVQKHKRY